MNSHTNTREEELRGALLKLIHQKSAKDSLIVYDEYKFTEKQLVKKFENTEKWLVKELEALLQSERESLLQELEERATVLTLRDHGGNNREEIEVVPLSVIKSFKGGK